MAIDTSQLTSYTPADLIAACAQARMTVLLGGQTMTMPDGRRIERISIADIDRIENAAYQAMDPNCGIVLVRRGSPT